ncbi:TPA: hypothetical protein U2D27_000286 [Streptococcus suis]|nr:hypothetical protein [Streptococcus suis]HEM6362314.1 hypothetical protein [Streptococcus suis]HEM6403259.1 hypothetical protein [Streptococcus suis]HEM6508854.1 hypothetical protein [Streptococcus suis]
MLRKYSLLNELEKDDPAILDRLKQEVKQGILIDKKTLTVDYDLLAPIYEPNKSYGRMVLDGLFEELELSHFLKSRPHKADYDLVQVLKLLVFQRILHSREKIWDQEGFSNR